MEYANRTYAVMGGSGGSAGNQATAERANELSELLARLDKIVSAASLNRDRAERLAERALGGRPIDAPSKGSPVAPIPSGAAAALRDKIESLDQILQMTSSHLDRLDTFV